MSFNRKVAVFSGSRTPFVKSHTNYLGVSNQNMLTAIVNDLVRKTKIENQVLGDVVAGAVMNHPFDFNLTREVVLGSTLSHQTPGLNIQRACGLGLEAANIIALKIAAGQIEAGIAGGSDTNSDIPLIGDRGLTHFLLKIKTARSFLEKIKVLTEFKFKYLIPQVPAVKEPRTGLSMGDHTELMVKQWTIDRAEQDELAFQSHQKASAAYDSGFLDDLITPFMELTRDTITRKDTTLEKLGKLRPAFDKTSTGTLTAGNSTPLTDGASVVLMGSPEWGHRNNLKPLAYFVDCEVAAIDHVKGEGLLMAPTVAVSRLLQRNQLKLQDFDFYEIHEAFAGQVLCTLKAWESADYCKNILGRTEAMGSIDRNKMNVKGGSLAFGHPFAATGGRIVATGAKILNEKGQGRLLISICTAGGMGVAAILEK